MLKSAVPHLSLVMSVMMLIFLVLDRVNRAMNFIGNDTFNVTLLIYSLLTILTSVYLIAANRRRR